MKSLESDIVIVGGGTAGLAAAVTIGERRAKAIVLEKAAITGGTSNMGSGLFAVESRLQKIKQITLTREEAFKRYMDFTHWRVNARLVSEFINRSAETIDWLEKMGVEFRDVTSHGPGNYPTQHTVEGPDSGPGIGPGQIGPASVMMKILTERAKNLGVNILLETTVDRVVKEIHVGDFLVHAVDKMGEGILVRSKATIIVTGGGQGILIARDLGASTIYDPYVKEHPAGTLGFERCYTVTFTLQQPNLLVNLNGERFVNEELVMSGVFLNNAISLQKENTAFMIIDDQIKNLYAAKGFDYAPGGIQVPITDAKNFDDEVTQLKARNNPYLIVAESLKELSWKAGINFDGLRNTIEEYNISCENGRDEIFHKSPKYLRAIKYPPFYAGKKVAYPVTRENGIIINHRTEALDRNYQVIPGLYAAGMDAACNIYYDTYPMIFPATAMGFAINSGRIAGENAAEYVFCR